MVVADGEQKANSFFSEVLELCLIPHTEKTGAIEYEDTGWRQTISDSNSVQRASQGCGLQAPSLHDPIPRPGLPFGIADMIASVHRVRHEFNVSKRARMPEEGFEDQEVGMNEIARVPDTEEDAAL